MADVRYASRDDVGPSADAPTRGVELTDASRTDVPMPSWPMLGALRKVALVVWKNLQLRGNRPTATILEVVFPLIAFVALAVMTPRNEYFDAPYFPGVPWMPPACVLQFESRPERVVLAEGVNAGTAKALAPEVCPGAGAPRRAARHGAFRAGHRGDARADARRVRAQVRPPGIERVAYGFTTPTKKTKTPRTPEHFAKPTSSSTRTPPASRSAACSLEGYADEARMARARGGSGGWRRRRVGDGGGVAVRAEDGVVVGYETRARGPRDEGARDAGTVSGMSSFPSREPGTSRLSPRDVTTIAPRRDGVPAVPLPPVYQTSAYAFVAKFLPLAVAATWTYTLLVCAGNVAYERETGLEASARAFGLPCGRTGRDTAWRARYFSARLCFAAPR